MGGGVEEEFVVVPHGMVWDGHDFSEEVFGGVVEGDVVIVGFGHFFGAVEAY